MKQRKVAGVLGLTIITLGIYQIVWFVKTKNEMNKMGAKIPTAWLLIVPIVSIWWMWKYSEGVEQVTGEKLSTVMSFVLLFLLSVIGSMIIQYEFNKVSASPAAAGSMPSPADSAPAQMPANDLPPTPPANPIPEAPTSPPVSPTPPANPAPAGESTMPNTPPTTPTAP